VTDVEQPEDEQRTPDAEAPAEEPAAPEAEASAEQPAAPEAEAPAAQAPADTEPVAEQPAEAEPVGEESVTAEPVAEESVTAEPVAEESVTAEPVAEEAAAAETPAEAAPVAEQPEAVEDQGEELPETPRVKPEIPGADLVPDIVPEGADALSHGEHGEEGDEPGAAESEEEAVAQPIAEVAISLASGARYTATGKRKTAVARVILKPGTGEYKVNGKALEEFFPRPTLQRTIRQPLETVAYEARMDVIAKLHGGGVSAQAGALRHGIARALLEADPNLRGELKRRGFLTRDARAKERKKAGLKKARKRPQFSKR
jgi:small subunit ribosomal protein S9